MEKRDHKQCLSPMGGGFMDMVTKGSMQSRVTEEVGVFIIEDLKGNRSIDWIVEKRSRENDYFRKLPENLKQEIVMRMKQLKTVGKSDDEIKAEFGKLAFSDTAIVGAIENLQNHCGFMMTSLVDLMCQKNEVGDIANNEFIEKQLGHDPYEVNLEDENWYAAQGMHCRKEQNKSKSDDQDASCKDAYRKDVTELIIPPIRLADYDSLLSCNNHFLGSEDYLKRENGSRLENSLKGQKDGTAGICEMLACSNHIDMLAGKEVACEKRDGTLSYKDLIEEIANIKCSVNEENKYCVAGKPNPILENIQKMFITECRIAGCMEDKFLTDKFRYQIKTNPNLKKIFETPKEELVSMSGSEQKFWDRFSGETAVMAKSDDFNIDSYSKVLEQDFTGRGYKEKPKVTPKEIIAKIEKESPVVDKAPQIQQEIENTKSAQQVTDEAHSLMAEVETRNRLMEEYKSASKEYIKQVTNNKSVISTSKYRQAKKEISSIRQSYNNLQRELEKRREERGQPKRRSTFESRFKDKIERFDDIMGGGRSLPGKKQKQREASKGDNHTYEEVLRDDYSKKYPLNQNYSDSSHAKEQNQTQAQKMLPRRMGKGGSIASPEEIAKIGDTSAGGSVDSSSQRGLRKAASLPALGSNATRTGKALLEEAIKKNSLIEEIGNEEIINLSNEVEVIDVVNELIQYRKENPDFKVGKIVVIKQGESKARLIPLFDEFGYFKSYGINSDYGLMKRIIIRPEGPIMVKFLTKAQSLRYEFDIATLRD